MSDTAPIAFADLVAGAEAIDGGFALSVPETWHQGRTAYGGFSTALALSAAMRIDATLPPLRSVQVSMIAPVAGRIEVRASLLRRGRNASWVSAAIVGEGGAVCFAATFVFMGPAQSALRIDHLLPPPDLIPTDEARPFVNERGPAFLRNHFDVRFALPRGADKRPEMCWWVRPRVAAGLDPMVEALLIADALPPGVMGLLPPNVPVSTMQWQVDLLTPVPRSGGWWLLQSIGDYAADGCSSQRMMMWDEAGAPVLAGLQSIAIFG